MKTLNLISKSKFTHLLMLCLFIALFASCKKNESTSKNAGISKNENGINLNLTIAQWHLVQYQNNGGEVKLNISGSTNADRVTIRSRGDGFISDGELILDANKKFSDDVQISFFGTSLPKGIFEESVLIKAYKGNDSLLLTLNSGSLHF